MAVDLTGGVDPSREYVLAQRPQNPEMRDSVSFWVVDDRGEIGLPRIGIEAVAANWDAHDIQVNVASPTVACTGNGPTGPRSRPRDPTGGPPCWVPAAWRFGAPNHSSLGRCPTTGRRCRLRRPT
jgi:hypothetical protein